MSDKHICQVAICGLNASQLRDWYAEVFGMVKGGKIFSSPPLSTDQIQGISPNPVETVSWLVDRQDYFQLEFFQFYRPRSKPRPLDWRPCDIGYSVLGIHSTDFDRTIARAAAHSDRGPVVPVGTPGDRRACVQDPEGNWLEILERDPIRAIAGTEPGVVRPELSAAARFMRLSVPSLAAARESFVEAMGLSEVTDLDLHIPAHEAQWGLPGAEAKTLLLRSRNFLVELVEYQSPEPKQWPPDYQICDQGFMNIAFGYRSTYEFDWAFEHARGSGMRPNGDPVDIGIFRVMYVNDPQGFSVEMLNARRALWKLSGFKPAQPYVQSQVDIAAPAEATWKRVIDHAGFCRWTLFDSRVLRPGTDSPDGPGCVRELKAFGLRFTEEIVAWEEGLHYAYRLRTGAPFRWHRGDVFVKEFNGFTRVRWAIRFEARLPLTGGLTAWILNKIFDRALRNLKKQLET
jgi:catechol 2,3-dioxygenase-like lactoylglutathione lyase family enzyme